MNQIDLTAIHDKTPHYGINVQLLAASKCKETGATVETFLIEMPRMILSEFLTHRVLSKNVASSRAIPTKRILQKIRDKPYYPMFWGENKSGMQSTAVMGNWKAIQCKFWWSIHRVFTLFVTQRLANLGLHKGWSNRLSEPHSYIKLLTTGTDWDNFLHLRADNDAQPEIAAAALLIEHLRHNAIYALCSNTNMHDANNWHYVFITPAERAKYRDKPQYLAQLDAARCARTSYVTHDFKEPNPAADIDTFGKLVGRKLHASPLEHPCFPIRVEDPYPTGNYRGWRQYRQVYESQREFENGK